MVIGEVQFYKVSFGDSLAERTQSFHNQLLARGVSSTLKTYDGVGHELTPEMKTDVLNFFKSFPLEPPRKPLPWLPFLLDD